MYQDTIRWLLTFVSLKSIGINLGLHMVSNTVVHATRNNLIW